MEAKDVWKLLDDVDHNARSVLAKNTELRAMLSQLTFSKVEKPFACRHGCTSFATAERLQTHLFNVHGEGEPLPLSGHESSAV